MNVYDGEQTIVVRSKDALVSFIQSVRASGEPTMLFLRHDDGPMMVVGVGGPESVLTFEGKDGTTFHSVGDTNRVDHLRFRCRDQVDEFMGEMAIPEAKAIDAALAFFDSAERPSGVNWERDW